MLPEITANVFTPLCIIILLFHFGLAYGTGLYDCDSYWRLLLMGQMKDYKNRSDRYIEASSNMDSSLVEYVNGIEVIKTFSQTGKSFQNSLILLRITMIRHWIGGKIPGYIQHLV